MKPIGFQPPKEFKRWRSSTQDRFLERACLIVEQNNGGFDLPADSPLAVFAMTEATKEAEAMERRFDCAEIPLVTRKVCYDNARDA